MRLEPTQSGRVLSFSGLLQAAVEKAPFDASAATAGDGCAGRPGDLAEDELVALIQ